MNDQVNTTVIGSYPIPIDLQQLMDSYFHAKTPSWNPVILQAVDDMVTAGVDLISDGQTRDPFLHIFIRGLQGCRIRARAEVIGPILFDAPINTGDLEFVRSFLPRRIKLLGLLIGAHTFSESVVDHFYHDKKQLAFDVADALAQEAHAMEPFVNMISIDEPSYANSFPEYAAELIDRMKRYVRCPIRLHACGDISSIASSVVDLPVDVLSHEFAASPQLFDVFCEYESKKHFCVGVVRSDDAMVEPVSLIHERMMKARDVFGDHIAQFSPDCGLRMLPRKIAFLKLQHLVKTARKMYD